MQKDLITLKITIPIFEDITDSNTQSSCLSNPLKRPGNFNVCIQTTSSTDSHT